MARVRSVHEDQARRDRQSLRVLQAFNAEPGSETTRVREALGARKAAIHVAAADAAQALDEIDLREWIGAPNRDAVAEAVKVARSATMAALAAIAAAADQAEVRA